MSQKITGFVSKAGKTFDAYLKYTDEKIQFDFEHSGETSAEKSSQEETFQPSLDTMPATENTPPDAEPTSDEYWASLMAGAAGFEEPESEMSYS